jgi:NAD(P)-dependent dehydrogenase (short-subunit alcohol dehydrogenase family)
MEDLTLQSEPYLRKVYNAWSLVPLRLCDAVLLQWWNSYKCQNTNRLENQTILLTGGNSGIGLEIARELVKRGAFVIIASRNHQKNNEAIEDIKSSLTECNCKIESMTFDLSDLNSIKRFVNAFISNYPNIKLNQVIMNSGIVPPQGNSKSAQGFELAVATNAIGPYFLLKLLIQKKMLTNEARILFHTGDIYITASDCTLDWSYGDSMDDRMMAYSRSKLGLNWLFHEIRNDYPDLWLNLIHPGVIKTNLVSESGFFHDFIAIQDCSIGAQTTIICATADRVMNHRISNEEASSLGLLVNGAYYHNTCGRMILPEDDLVLNFQMSVDFKDKVDEIIAKYL